MVNENIKRKDMELILEVNRKAIEVNTEVAEQYEEIINSLNEIKKTQAEQIKVQAEHGQDIKKLITASDETNKDLFRIQVLFVTGLLSLVLEVIQLFIKH